MFEQQGQCANQASSIRDQIVGAGAAMGMSCNSTSTPTVRVALDVAATNCFGDALRAAIHGQRITRAGWNAPGQYVTAQWPDKGSKMSRPYLYLKNAQHDMLPWVPSQGDLFANDWAILPIQPV